jgi:D-alanyl-D-alanine carboxypeptidase
LGLIIKRITGRSWRREVTRRVIRPLRLTGTDLPAPGDRVGYVNPFMLLGRIR